MLKKTTAFLLSFLLLFSAFALPRADAAVPARASVPAQSFTALLSTAFGRLCAFLAPFFPNPEQAVFPKALTAAKTVLLLDCPAGDEALALGSLQGVLANVSETQILFKDGAFEAYLSAAGSVEIERPDSADVQALLCRFAPLLNGYVLCDDAGAQAAVSVAAALQAVVIPESLLPAAEAAGLPRLEDARGWTDRTLRRSRYFPLLSRSAAVLQPAALAPKLVDLAVMAGAYFGYPATENACAFKKTFSFLWDNAVVFGWDSVLGEYDTVAALSALNACLVPADHACNLSVLSAIPAAELKQSPPASEPAAEGHTVCILMSDGDNLQWMLTGFTDGAHFGSDERGGFPMAWGVPASLCSLSPSMARYLYGAASPNDEFILELSGLGYTYPSRWTNPFARFRMFSALSASMEAADLHVAAVLDDGGFTGCAMWALAAQKSVSGIFYLDFSDYAGAKGAVQMLNGKPVIGARYKLWNGKEGCSPEEIAAAVNAAPKDPADRESYSLIVAHAWSGTDETGALTEGGDTMAAVARMVNAFGPDVRIVSPSAFVSLVAAAH